MAKESIIQTRMDESIRKDAKTESCRAALSKYADKALIEKENGAFMQAAITTFYSSCIFSVQLPQRLLH